MKVFFQSYTASDITLPYTCIAEQYKLFWNNNVISFNVLLTKIPKGLLPWLLPSLEENNTFLNAPILSNLFRRKNYYSPKKILTEGLSSETGKRDVSFEWSNHNIFEFKSDKASNEQRSKHRSQDIVSAKFC